MTNFKNIIFSSLLIALPGVATAQEMAQGGDVGEGVPFTCPVDIIKSSYGRLVNEDDVLIALAIEKQTMAICRQSQEALIRISKNDDELREIYESEGIITSISKNEIDKMIADAREELRLELLAEVEEMRDLAEQRLRSLNSKNTEIASLKIKLEERNAAQTPAFVAPVTEVELIEEEEIEEASVKYNLVAIMRDADGEKALISEGSVLHTVRVGDVVNGADRVIGIFDNKVTIMIDGLTSETLE